jgi:hypothetical protein
VDAENAAQDVVIAGKMSEVEDDATPTLGSSLDAATNKIINLGAPTNANDAATKAYVDANAGGGGGGDLVLIDSFTSVTDHTVEFNDVFTDEYDTYMVVFDGLRGSDGSYVIRAQYKRDGEDDFDETGYDFATVNFDPSAQWQMLEYMDQMGNPASTFLPPATTSGHVDFNTSIPVFTQAGSPYAPGSKTNSKSMIYGARDATVHTVSETDIVAPGACSPSLNVVSNISIFLIPFLLNFYNNL